MTLTIATQRLAKARLGTADWLRRLYALALLAIALGGWSPVLWDRMQCDPNGHDIANFLEKQVRPLSLEPRPVANETRHPVIQANYLQ